MARGCEAQELERMEVDMMGVSEVCWSHSGTLTMRNHIMYYSCDDSLDPYHRHSVAIMVNKTVESAVTNFMPVSETVMLLQINTTPIKLNIV